MVARIRIGELFGQKGVFISRPGKSVLAGGESLLMDTRFDYLEVHQAGRFSPSRHTIQGAGDLGVGDLDTSIFDGYVDFPPLSYEPLAYASPFMVNSGYVTDDNTGWYPCMSGAQQPFGLMPEAGDDHLAHHLAGVGYQIENNNSRLRFKAYYVYNYADDDTGTANIDVDYIIFRNRAL